MTNKLDAAFEIEWKYLLGPFPGIYRKKGEFLSQMGNTKGK